MASGKGVASNLGFFVKAGDDEDLSEVGLAFRFSILMGLFPLDRLA